jgi:hypothetical protein
MLGSECLCDDGWDRACCRVPPPTSVLAYRFPGFGRWTEGEPKWAVLEPDSRISFVPWHAPGVHHRPERHYPG